MKIFLHKIVLLCFLLSMINLDIIAQTETSLKLLSPNGGEYWTTGAFPRIAWKSTNITVVKIEISYDGGLVWEIVSPAAIATSGYYSNWQLGSALSGRCLVKIAKYDDPAVYDISESYFSIVSDNSVNNIVILGSSTAAGVGPSKPDSAWATRYKNYMYERNTTVKVINLAVGGYTTYDVMPTGFIPPPDRPAPKISNNISKAVDYNPKAIIINLPSNDVNLGFSITEQLINYDTMLAVASDKNIPVWITTTQPRNFTLSQILKQIEMRDSTFTRFGEKAIDFWTDIADTNGRINPIYDSGDGIHLNDKAHDILFDRVLAAEIYNPLVLSVLNARNIFQEYELMQNYPNPFNSTTRISWQSPVGSWQTLKVYDVLGNEVATLVDEYREAGRHEVEFQSTVNSRQSTIGGRKLASGIYMYRLHTENYTSVKKLILMK